ncbi:MAG: DUF5053 domain-containing protein [Dysgonamonadaceae bacterium]|jgi:ribosomal protein S25|nr:DUF5053 domain-containing protein [Dysgonamonadaceae bacterium]
MKTRNEIEKLKSEFLALKTESEIKGFKEKFKKRWSEKTDKEKDEFCSEFNESTQEKIFRAEKIYSYINVRLKLADILDIVSVSYIAERYFKKSRSWFSQRLNGNLVNGVPVTFNENEIKKLSKALDDISLRIKNTARSIA